MAQSGLCNFDRGQYEEHFCEIILHLDFYIQEETFEDISTFNNTDHFDHQSETVYAILLESIMGNISLK